MCSVFFNETATTEIYTLSLHDALPILRSRGSSKPISRRPPRRSRPVVLIASITPSAASGSRRSGRSPDRPRSEEHTSELQSRQYLVCRLLLENKNHTHESDL